MAALIITGKVEHSKQQFTISALVGTETISASVAAGEMAIVMDSSVPQHSLNVDILAKRFAEALREAGYAA